MDPALKIVIVDENPIRAEILKDGLREAGFTHVVHINETANLLARIYAIDPEVILIDLENPSRDVLEQMFQVSRIVKRPIAMFVDQSSSASIEASVDAGVSAYIVDGLKKERMKHILDLCISRFNAFSFQLISTVVNLFTVNAIPGTKIAGSERKQFIVISITTNIS